MLRNMTCACYNITSFMHRRQVLYNQAKEQKTDQTWCEREEIGQKERKWYRGQMNKEKSTRERERERERR